MGSAPDDGENTPLSIFTLLFPPVLSVADGSKAVYRHLLHNDDNDLFPTTFFFKKFQHQCLVGTQQILPYLGLINSHYIGISISCILLVIYSLILMLTCLVSFPV